MVWKGKTATCRVQLLQVPQQGQAREAIAKTMAHNDMEPLRRSGRASAGSSVGGTHVNVAAAAFAICHAKEHSMQRRAQKVPCVSPIRKPRGPAIQRALVRAFEDLQWRRHSAWRPHSDAGPSPQQCGTKRRKHPAQQREPTTPFEP